MPLPGPTHDWLAHAQFTLILRAMPAASIFYVGMICVFGNTLRTLREEGVRTLPRKILLYFRRGLREIRFMTLRMPHGDSPEKILDFILGTADKLIAPSQFRHEIHQACLAG